MIRITYSTESSSLDSATGERSLSSSVRSLVFDAVEVVNHEAAASLTGKAVEGGVTSDHKRADPRRVSVEAWVSNTPLDAPPEGGLDATVSADAIEQTDTGANVIGFTSEFDRVRGVFNELHRLARNPIALTLSTPSQEYEDVQLVSVTTPTDAESGVDAARFSLEFQEVEVAETRETSTPIPREPRGARAADAGGQEGGEDSDANSENNASDLHTLLENLGAV